jgi:hypothetical protein
MRYRCPKCNCASVPVSRAISETVFRKPFKCGACGARLKRKVDLADFVVGIPFLVIAILLKDRIQSSESVWLLVTFTWLLGLALWTLTVRYDVIED